jgi:hypothetical protein
VKSWAAALLPVDLSTKTVIIDIKLVFAGGEINGLYLFIIEKPGCFVFSNM